MPEKLLVVEDDNALQKILCNFLQSEGFLTDHSSTGSLAIKKINESIYDLVLLDLGLPDIQGETVLQNVRKTHPNLPVIILTAKSKPHEVAQGLNLGANDYLAKPFSIEELLARINARIRKHTVKNGKLKISNLYLDLNKMIAIRDKQQIELTKTEFELLKFLIENAGKVLSREAILNHVWDYTSDVETRVVDVYIGYLRNKIDKGFTNKLIKNKRGFGYLMEKD